VPLGENAPTEAVRGGSCALRVLVVEDDSRLNSLIRAALGEEGYATDSAADGDEASYLVSINPYDVIVLDLGLPKRDGLSLCREWRSAGNPAAILILTARDGVTDRVAGLDSGADDYLVKPFHVAELLARVRALLRREQSAQRRTTILQIADLTLDTASHVVTRGARTIPLTDREFSILRYLMHHAEAVVSRTELLEHVWDEQYDGLSNIVDVYIRRLRQHIDESADLPLIHTVRGAGYRITADEE
jgi:DNA-binding response OmpR family regulator